MRRTLLVAAVLSLSAAPASAVPPAASPTPLCCAPNGSVEAIAVSGTTAYVGGHFRHVGPVTGSFVTVDGSDGLLDTRWPRVDGTVRAIVGDGGGGWYLAGFFTSVGGVPRDGLAHLRGDGTLDPDWAPSTDGFPNAIAVFGGRVYVGGTFDQVNGATARKNLAAFDRTTGAVTAVGAGGGANGAVSAFAVRPGGIAIGGAPPRLYVGGDFTTIDGQARSHIASYAQDGTLTDTFANTGFNNSVNTLLEVNVGTRLVPSWRLHVGGEFTLFNTSDARTRLAAFDEDDDITSWAPSVPASPSGDPTVAALAAGGARIYVAGSAGLRAFARDGAGAAVDWSPNLGFNGHASALLVSGDTVYVGGRLFEVGGGVRRTNAAAFDVDDDTVVRPWDPEPSGSGIAALASAADGAVAVAGDFAAAGGTPRRHLAAIDLVTGELTPFHPDLDREVNALAIRGGRLYAGGAFTTVNGGTPRSRLAAFDRTTGAATAFDPNPNGRVSALGVSTEAVYAAGSFSTVNGSLPRDRIAGLDPDTGAARDFRPAFEFGVNAFAVRGATVFMGGSFSTMAGEDRHNLASVRDVPGTFGAPTFFDPDPDGFVFDIALDGDRVYAGGQFDNAGTPPQPRSRVAAFDATTGAAVPWDASVTGLVQALVKAGDQIVAGGSISAANGQPRTNLAAFAAGAGELADWAPVPDGLVAAMAASSDAGLVVGGSFDRIGPALTGPLAAFALAPTAPVAPAATAGDAAATVTVAPPPSGGAEVSSYTVTASPGGGSATGAGPSFVIGGLANGAPHTFTVTATNRVGTSPASRPSNPVTPGAPVVPGADGTTPVITSDGTPPASAADTTPPAITGLRITNRRFRPARRATPRVAKAKRGTAFRFTLSEPATTSIAVARTLPGRRKGARCVKPRTQRRGKCTRSERVHVLRRTTVPGVNRVAYSGRVGKKKLVRGRYRATLVATDAAGNRSAPARVRFSVVRR